MFYEYKNPMLNLQLFADGAGVGESDTSAEGTTAGSGVAAANKGAKNHLENVVYGVQDDAQVADVQEPEKVEKPDRNAEFERLIKGEYKDLYDARVQDTIQKRLKGTKETVDKYEALLPTLDLLTKKYGVKADDIAGLSRAIEEDDSFFEEEASKRGISVEQLKEIRRMERENESLRKQMQEKATQEQASKIYASWMDQAEKTKTVYPTFDLDAEMQNPKFLELLKNNIDVRTAYEVLHKDEIIPAAMQFTARTVEQKITNKIIANGARPPENGMNSRSASLVKSDVSQLSKEDRAEIIRRVQRGEKIRF